MFPASDVVVGATDVAEMIRFFGVFDFRVSDRRPDEVELRNVEADTAGIVVVQRERASRRRQPYEVGAAAIDVYTTDLERSADRAAEAGFEVGTPGDLSLGPVTLRQQRIHGPDHVPVVLVESSHRRSSLLDRVPNGLHSEGHSVVWIVEDRDEEAAWWVDKKGATKGMDLDFAVDGVSDLLDLPDRSVDVKMTMLSDSDVTPFRLELLEFVGRTQRSRNDVKRRAGIIGLRFAPGDWTESPGGVAYQAG